MWTSFLLNEDAHILSSDESECLFWRLSSEIF
jgi:hypothetical protein